jgi:hypothetical protein
MITKIALVFGLQRLVAGLQWKASAVHGYVNSLDMFLKIISSIIVLL